jgi:hypothetical protein
MIDDSEDKMELGGLITLVGFNGIEPAKLIVIKKVVGNFTKKLQDRHTKFENLSVHFKEVHSSKNEIKTKTIIGGKVHNTESIDFNLFFALNNALTSLMTETEKDL